MLRVFRAGIAYIAYLMAGMLKIEMLLPIFSPYGTTQEFEIKLLVIFYTVLKIYC